MKQLALIGLLVLTACRPSAQVVQAALAQTQAAVPTVTPTATLTATPTRCSPPTPGPTFTKLPRPTASSTPLPATEAILARTATAQTATAVRESQKAVIIIQDDFGQLRTPLPSPTPSISSARAVVTVFTDTNSDGVPQASEGLDCVPVQLVLPGGKVLSATTIGGEAEFGLSGYLSGIQIKATLPGYHRNYQFYLPQSGTVPIQFGFPHP